MRSAPAGAAAPGRRVLIVHGVPDGEERPDEADTLAQCALVGSTLQGAGHECRTLGLGLDLSALRTHTADGVDLVFNLVESLEGRCDLAHLPATVLEALDVPFSGAGARALYVSTDKLLAKALLRAAGLPTPDWWLDAQSLTGSAAVIVKSVHEDASFGLDAGSVVAASRAGAELRARARRFGGRWFAERYIEGREFNVALIEEADGPRVLPLAEIVFEDHGPGQPRIVDYAAKWQVDSFGYQHTPRRFIDEDGADVGLAAELRALALQVWQLLGLSGYARVDFRVDTAAPGAPRPYILEVNANPCLAEDAGFSAAARTAGLDLQGVLERIVAAALPRPVG